MNILYFHVHDQGRYVQPYGYPVSTPRLQQLAEEGVLFRNAFCAAPSCSPSRAALLTGRYPHHVGMYGLTNEGWHLADYDQHLRKTLSDAGYETVLCGTHHVTDHTDEGVARLGYDRVLIEEDEGDLAEYRTQAAIDYLREFAARAAPAAHRAGDAAGGPVAAEAAAQSDPAADAGRPFFLALGYDITHHSKWNRSYVHSFSRFGPLDVRYARANPGLPDTPETRLEAALQRRASEFQDYQLGRVLDELDRLELREQTLLIYTTDHGPGLPGAKLNLSDAGTGVSLVMRGPGVSEPSDAGAVARHQGGGAVAADSAVGAAGAAAGTGAAGAASPGTVVDALVHHVDLFPTICDLCGIEPPAWLEGASLLPLVRGESSQLHEAVFMEQSYHGTRRPLRSVRTPRYRYVRRIGEERMTVADYIADTGEAKEVYLASGADELEVPREMLYDLIYDPEEHHNVVDDPAYREVAEELRGRLEEWMRETDDPARSDDVPPQPPRPEWATRRAALKAGWGDHWAQAAARLGATT